MTKAVVKPAEAENVNSPAKTALATPEVNAATPEATPDNTPLPGGGRWRWDIALPGWVDLDAPLAPAGTALSTPAPKE